MTNKITCRLIQTPETTWRYPWQIFTQSIDQYYTVKKINEKNWNLLEKDKKHQTNFFIPGFGRNFNWEYKISSIQIDLFWNLVLSIFFYWLNRSYCRIMASYGCHFTILDSLFVKCKDMIFLYGTNNRLFVPSIKQLCVINVNATRIYFHHIFYCIQHFFKACSKVYTLELFHFTTSRLNIQLQLILVWPLIRNIRLTLLNQALSMK